MRSIILSKSMLEEIHSEAAISYPEECCGLMFGISSKENEEERKIVRLRKMKNVFEIAGRHHRYAIDPKEFLKIEKESRENGEEVVGVFHSHPDAPSRPSKLDLVRAWPELSYIVVEVRGGKVATTRSWILNEDRNDFLPEEIEIRN